MRYALFLNPSESYSEEWELEELLCIELEVLVGTDIAICELPCIDSGGLLWIDTGGLLCIDAGGLLWIDTGGLL